MKPAWLVLPALLLLAPTPARAASYCDGNAYLTRDAQLLRFDRGTQNVTPIGELPYPVNALAAAGGELYGIARPHGQAVKVTADGSTVELGQISGGPASGFSGAYVGAISGDTWLLMHGSRIYSVALDGLKVVSEAPLSIPLEIGDWAADARGRLVTISTHGAKASLVSIDPRSGQVHVLAQPAGLPSNSVYGAVWILGNDLYAWHNSSGNIYQLDVAQPGSAQVVLEGLASGSIDAASCEPRPTPTQTPSAAPLPAAPIQAATRHAQATVNSAASAIAPSPTTAPTSRPTSGPVATATPIGALPKVARAEEVPIKDDESIQRLLAVGAGAMMLVLLLGLRATRRPG